MNRNVLKIIALITMIIDHVGFCFFPDIIWFRVVGRIAFPIYAFFIAQGMYYSRNKQKYITTLFLFGVLAELPYMFLNNNIFKLNVMFTFIFAAVCILLINKLL
ncbi:MAG: conjugal transfer protein TraX, partial [Clostridia bacterium]|nr:conjugal transfer protein TraX [Clostridia bacterium]